MLCNKNSSLKKIVISDISGPCIWIKMIWSSVHCCCYSVQLLERLRAINTNSLSILERLVFRLFLSIAICSSLCLVAWDGSLFLFGTLWSSLSASIDSQSRWVESYSKNKLLFAPSTIYIYLKIFMFFLKFVARGQLDLLVEI